MIRAWIRVVTVKMKIEGNFNLIIFLKRALKTVITKMKEEMNLQE